MAIVINGNGIDMGNSPISNVDIQNDVDVVDKTYADLKVALTGDQTINGVKTFSSSPVVPTPTNGDNSTKVATTSFVNSEVGTANSSLVKTALNATGTAPIYACRACVNFNGTGVVDIRWSGNVSSVTDNGVGEYTVNFTTAMQDINYTIVGSSAPNTTDQGCVSPYTLTTANVRVGTSGTTSGYVVASTNGDHLNINIAIFR